MSLYYDSVMTRLRSCSSKELGNHLLHILKGRINKHWLVWFRSRSVWSYVSTRDMPVKKQILCIDKQYIRKDYLVVK